jgi:FemAB-related protein (PEP-CTERM system-associated)
MSSASGLSVRLASEADMAAWQEFVDATPGAACTHHAGWLGVLRDAYWVMPCFLLATGGDGAVQGILPAYRSRSFLAGSHVSSLEDGVLARDAAATQALLVAARALRDELGARYLQIRGGPVDGPGDATVPTVRTFISTERGRDPLWKAVKKKTRWGVRQAEKQGIAIEHDAALDRLDDFYRAYAAHMRDLGTPVIGADAFHAIRDHLGRSRLRLYLVKANAQLIGGMLCIINADRWTDYFAIVRRSPETEFANYLLYWHVIRDAAENGVPILDLGRSTPNSNVHHFKRKWGGTNVDVPYHFYVGRNRSARNVGLQRFKEGNGLPQRIWSHLPLAVSNRLGPLLRKQLPFV